MKKTITYIILILVVLSCNNKQNINNSEVIGNEEAIVNNNVINDAFSVEMNKIINEMILFYDTAGFGIDSNIIVIDFIKEKENCYFRIYEDISYFVWLKYYTFVNNKLIVFYDINDDCICGLIDTTKLIKFNGIPLEFIFAPEFDSTINMSAHREKMKEYEKHITKIKGFPDEANCHYEPIGRKYKIHSKDSLELVFTGYL